ncbi:hypothetical protein QBC38DRAFT_487414 [Podospora fimiseda]|uniref:Uncharacterized protein n=1 Tax=Podospora fimiseda TaxID=252190 RepID=A0AAN7GSL4_9PEZI|nr:hypothetical protein QBC38DRAFT_487414 [Podospora fimiseda]
MTPRGKGKGKEKVSSSPGTEKGAKGISKWLGKSWEELARWAQEERQRAGLTDKYKGKLPPEW